MAISAQAPQDRSPGRRPRSLEARISAAYPALPPSERRLADVMLQQQAAMSGQTAGSLAAKAGVSTSTAARLVRALGYATFPDAKRQILAERYWGSPRAGPETSESPGEAAASVEKVVKADLENIQATVAGIPARTLSDVCQAIAAARRVWILGLRSGFGLAHHAAHYVSLLKPDVQVLPVGNSSPSHDVASIRHGDVLLAIGFRRRPRLLATLIAEARAAGAVTVLITDLSAAASARAAHHVLRCRCHSPSPFNSFSAAVTLINVIAWNVAALLGESGVAHIGRVDRLVHLLDDVSTPLAAPQGAKARVGRGSTRSA